MTHAYIEKLTWNDGTSVYKDLVLLWGLYASNLTWRLDIDRWDGSEKVVTVTTNLEDHGYMPDEDCFFIKNYSECEGLGDALVAAGVVEPTDRETLYFGPFDASANEYRLTPKYRKELDI